MANYLHVAPIYCRSSCLEGKAILINSLDDIARREGWVPCIEDYCEARAAVLKKYNNLPKEGGRGYEQGQGNPTSR
jgi:hypothetical protein